MGIGKHGGAGPVTPFFRTTGREDVLGEVERGLEIIPLNGVVELINDGKSMENLEKIKNYLVRKGYEIDVKSTEDYYYIQYIKFNKNENA
ncbi:MAG: hypothetical protein Q8P15_03300 [Nanoarchaeota archaeon]|nr:hypothetical protein [Nanoarchaeota archaeon]